jgi:hypothetical protein
LTGLEGNRSHRSGDVRSEELAVSPAGSAASSSTVWAAAWTMVHISMRRVRCPAALPAGDSATDGTAHGGHLLEAYVRPTLEVVVVESSRHLRRKMRGERGLALLDLT